VLLNKLKQVTTFTIIHDNAEETLMHEAFPIAYDIRVLHGAQTFHFILSDLLFLPVHSADIDLLHDHEALFLMFLRFPLD